MKNRIDAQHNSEYNCDAYKAIANSFTDGGVDGAKVLSQIIAQHQDTLAAHGNLGLAELLVEAYPIRRLIDASRIYASISLEGLARSMGDPFTDNVPLTEATVVAEIDKGTLCATIDKRSNIVIFSSDDLRQQEAGAIAQTLLLHLQQAVDTSAALRGMHSDILTKRAFLSRAMANAQSSQVSSSVVSGGDGYAEVYLE